MATLFHSVDSCEYHAVKTWCIWRLLRQQAKFAHRLFPDHSLPAGLFLSRTLSVHSRYPCRPQCPVNTHSALSTPMANSWFYNILASLLFCGGGGEGMSHSCFSDMFYIFFLPSYKSGPSTILAFPLPYGS